MQHHTVVFHPVGLAITRSHFHAAFASLVLEFIHEVQEVGRISLVIDHLRYFLFYAFRLKGRVHVLEDAVAAKNTVNFG